MTAWGDMCRDAEVHVRRKSSITRALSVPARPGLLPPPASQHQRLGHARSDAPCSSGALEQLVWSMETIVWDELEKGKQTSWRALTGTMKLLRARPRSRQTDELLSSPHIAPLSASAGRLSRLPQLHASKTPLRSISASPRVRAELTSKPRFTRRSRRTRSVAGSAHQTPWGSGELLCLRLPFPGVPISPQMQVAVQGLQEAAEPLYHVRIMNTGRSVAQSGRDPLRPRVAMRLFRSRRPCKICMTAAQGSNESYYASRSSCTNRFKE